MLTKPQRVLLLIVASLAAGLLAVTPVFGAGASGFSAALSCSGFTTNGGNIVANRDNTGSGAESIAINVIDGSGNIIYQSINALPLNWQVSLGTGAYGWRRTPAANPLTLNVVSLAGNGLSSEVIYTVSANCDTLATAETVAPAAVVTNTNVSASIAPGQDVPIPTNNTAAIEQLPYYMIVNTENLNLRSGDGPNFTLVAVVKGGTRAQVIGRNENRSWWLLDVGGYRGWAIGDFLIPRGDLTPVPVVPVQGELQPITFVTSLPRNVFSQPNNFTRNFVCEIPAGEYVVTGKDRFDVFYEIVALCDDGTRLNAWIKGEDGVFRNPAALRLPVTG